MSKISISGRKKARRYALQALYGWLITHNPINDIESYVLSEHDPATFDVDYFLILLHQIPFHIDDIELIMEPYLTRQLVELDAIERTVLRISVYELKYRLDIPYRIVINEALELAKTFGATDGFKFVNGVLDKVAKELRSREIKA
jgi:N utilization substance protein B